MKRILAFLLAFVMLFALAACGQQAPTPAAEGSVPGQTAAAGEPAGAESAATEPIELNLWWWGEGDTPGSEAWLQETVEKYKAVAPNVTINLSQQTEDDLYPSWEASIQAGSGADIQFLWTGIYAISYIWDNHLADITELVDAEELSHWTNLEGLSYGGKPYLSPWYQISIVILYNKELFSKAGLDPENPPQTWEELLAACETLKQSGVIPFELGGIKDGWATPWLYAVFGPAAHDSAKEYIEAGVTPGAFLEKEHLDWLNKIYELVQKGYTNPMAMSYDWYQGRESFLRGESAMGLATNGQAIQWINEMGGEDVAGIINIPVMGDGAMAGKLNNQAHSFAIPEFSKHKQEAADFLVFMHQPEQLKSWYEHTKNFPCDDRFDTSWISTASEKQIYNELLNNSCIYPELYIPAQVDSEGVYAALQSLFDNGTPESASQMIEDTAEKWRSMNKFEFEGFEDWAANF